MPARGVILWSGPKYEKTARFVHSDVKQIVFSPNEQFLLTNNHRRDDVAAIKVFHIPTGKLLRTFPLYPDGFLEDYNKRYKGKGQDDQPPP